MIKYTELSEIRALVSSFQTLFQISLSHLSLTSRVKFYCFSLSSIVKESRVQFMPSISYLIQRVFMYPHINPGQPRERMVFGVCFPPIFFLALLLFSTSFLTFWFLQIRLGRGRGTNGLCASFHGVLLNGQEAGQSAILV